MSKINTPQPVCEIIDKLLGPDHIARDVEADYLRQYLFRLIEDAKPKPASVRGPYEDPDFDDGYGAAVRDYAANLKALLLVASEDESDGK